MSFDGFNGAPLAEGPLAVTSAVKLLGADTAALTSGHPQCAIISVRTAPIVYTTAGTTPSGSASPPVGHPIAKDTTFAIYGESSIIAAKFIRDGSTSADLYVTVYG